MEKIFGLQLQDTYFFGNMIKKIMVTIKRNRKRGNDEKRTFIKRCVEFFQR